MRAVISQGGPPRGRHRSEADQHGRVLGRSEAGVRNGGANITKDELIAEMDAGARRRCPGIEPSFSQPIRDNVLESISQIDGQIVIKVFGDDSDVLQRQTERGARS